MRRSLYNPKVVELKSLKIGAIVGLCILLTACGYTPLSRGALLKVPAQFLYPSSQLLNQKTYPAGMDNEFLNFSFSLPEGVTFHEYESFINQKMIHEGWSFSLMTGERFQANKGHQQIIMYVTDPKDGKIVLVGNFSVRKPK